MPKKAAAGDQKAKAEKPQQPIKQAEQPAATPAAAPSKPVENVPPKSKDPVEAAIQKRLDEIEVELSKCRSDLDKIQAGFEGKKDVRQTLYKQQQDLRAELNKGESGRQESQEQRKGLITKKQDLRHKRDVKIADRKKLREQLTGNLDDFKDVESYTRKIDDDIRKLEAKQSSSVVSLRDEKDIVTQIAKLQNAKKSFKGYKDLCTEIDRDGKQISELDDQITAATEANQSVWDEKKAIMSKLDAVKEKIEALNAAGDEQGSNRTEIRDKLKALQDERTEQRQQLKEHKDKKWQEEKDKRAAAKQASFDRRNALEQERQKERLEKEAEELKQEPYSEEVEVIDRLLKFIEPFAASYRAQQKAAEAARAEAAAAKQAEGAKTDDAAKAAETAKSSESAKAEGPGGRSLNMPEGTPIKRETEDTRPLNKRNKQPAKIKAKNVDLKLNVQTYNQFELVSIVPPNVAADCEKTLQELRKKRGEYKERAKKLHQERLKAHAQKTAARSTASSSETPAADGEPAATTADSDDATTPDTTTATDSHETTKEATVEVTDE